MNQLAIIFSQFFFAIIYLFVIGWIGRHSNNFGYVSISLFVEKNEPVGFNFIFRVLSIVIYLIMLSTILYSFSLDSLTKNIYLVSVYYVILKWFTPIITGRFKLVNKPKELVYSISILIVSYFSYDLLISNKSYILPDFSTIANEIWIIVIIFLYEMFNKINISNSGKEKRIDRYIFSKYKKFKNKYDDIISLNLEDKRLIPVIYGIMIYENFNRGFLFRVIENSFLYKLGKAKTLGIMQITTKERINDKQSVTLAIDKINKDFKYISLNESVSEDSLEYYTLELLLTKYNPDSDYTYNVITVSQKIDESFYNKRNINWDGGYY